jgi:MoaA/NifB/PqqE/SkfB family radical SAM enzyme
MYARLEPAKLLWGYLSRQTKLKGLPVEYIVETTAKCNLYCPMCPRETHKQPKEDMADEIFDRLVSESGASAEHMMLIGWASVHGSPRFSIASNIASGTGRRRCYRRMGPFSDEKMSERLLATRLQHITLSFDGATKESFEFYRKGARFEKVRDNFVRFARMKKERGSTMQVVVQMVRMERNAGEVDDFKAFWSGVPGSTRCGSRKTKRI